MRRRSFILLGTILASALSLSGCFFFFKEEENIVVTAPTINVVSSLTLNLQGTVEKTLYPELSDSTIKNPVFDYASSNPSVATISSSGLVKAVSVGKCNITITLQSNRDVNKTVEVTVKDQAITKYKYTIMFYMCGSDLEYVDSETKDTDQYFFTRDIQEMLSVKNLPDDVRIVIETGGTTKWGMHPSFLEGATKISANNLQRWEINNSTNKLHLVESLSTNNMADENSFSEFLSWGLDNYDAEYMGVVISGHGGGIAGCAYDDNYTYKYGDEYYQNTLQTFEVAKATKTALANSERDKFTWIGYDCCLMQCADIATINSDYFEYMIASQESETASGWNHDEYLTYLGNNPEVKPIELLGKICDTFLDENHKDEGKSYCYQTLSVLDLSKADALVTEFNKIATSIGTTTTGIAKAKTAFENSYNEFGDAIYGLCDFNDLLDKLSSYSYSLDVASAKAAVNNMVIHNSYCDQYKKEINLCGLNAFFPEKINSDKKYKDYSLQVGKEDYLSAYSTKFNKWQEICKKYSEKDPKYSFGW